MNDEQTKQAGKKTVLIRVVEWTAWLPVYKDPNKTNLAMAEGVTGFEAFDYEKLLDIGVMGTGTTKFFPITDPEGEVQNVNHGSYAFQAVLATETGPGQIPAGPVTEETTKQSVVMPGAANRETRRAVKKGK